jgi:hypothetical protein
VTRRLKQLEQDIPAPGGRHGAYGRRLTARERSLALLLLSLAAVRTGLGQNSLRPLEFNRVLPAGVRVNSLSMYGGAYGLPGASAGGAAASSGTFGSIGGSANLGWYKPGERARVSTDYTVAYNANSRYSDVNAFDHFLHLSLEFKPASKLTLVLDGAAESTTTIGLLSRQTGALSLASQAADLSTIQTGTSVAGAAATVADSPLGAALFGTRRRGVVAGMSLAFSSSSRTTWWMSAHFSRYLPSHGTGAPQTYSGGAGGGLSGGIHYSITPRTQLQFVMDAARSYSRLERMQIAASSLGLERTMSPRWFLHAQAGYGAVWHLRGSSTAPVSSYQAAGGVGVRSGGHAVVLSATRRLGNAYGLGANSTYGAGLAWNWHGPASSWSVAASAGYERFLGAGVLPLEGMSFSANLSRRLSAETSLSFEALFTQSAGLVTPGSVDPRQQGVRVAFVWRPGYRGIGSNGPTESQAAR